MLEVLVAMLVLAVGLLGVAALQLRGAQFSHDAYLRSQASILAYDVSDRMRLNVANAASYVGTYTVPTASPPTCSASAVSAANDLACFRRRAYEALPPGSQVNIAAVGGEYTVTILWTDRDSTTRTITYTFVP